MLNLELLDRRTRDAALAVAHRARDRGGRAVIIGGSTRDLLLGAPVSDVDIEVSGIDADRMPDLLEGFEAFEVGVSFGVWKLAGIDIDVSVPRTEAKTGEGHRGFHTVADPTLDFATAAARRDFTINAIGFDPLDGELLDPHGGLIDLEAKVLRAVRAETFVEDELRVLRGMQFIARFDLRADPALIALCSTLTIDHLPAERIFGEWRKLILAGHRISAGLEFLRATGWLAHFPELAATVGVEQDPQWHPEGDVWIHTGAVMDVFAAERTGDDLDDLVVGLAALCHDFGKPLTTEFIDGRWRAHGHEAAGVEPTRTFLKRMTSQPIWLDVEPLVEAHLRPSQLYASRASGAAIRRLARKVGRLDRLVRVASADALGRPPLVLDRFEAGDWLLEHAAADNVVDQRPQPILRGRDLMDEFGLAPGPRFGVLLDAALDAQIDGAFAERGAALEWMRRQLDQSD